MSIARFCTTPARADRFRATAVPLLPLYEIEFAEQHFLDERLSQGAVGFL